MKKLALKDYSDHKSYTELLSTLFCNVEVRHLNVHDFWLISCYRKMLKSLAPQTSLFMIIIMN